MHDYQVVATLVERLTDQLDGRDRVRQVRIRANPVFSPDALEQAFEMLTRQTRLEGSRLLIEKSEDHECPACRASWTPAHDDLIGSLVICPTCSAPSPMPHHMGIEVLAIT
jgi:Zn finger protein HypA/HybF involved in hydrogenase expression